MSQAPATLAAGWEVPAAEWEDPEAGWEVPVVEWGDQAEAWVVPVGESALQAPWNCLRSLFDGKALNLFAKHQAEQKARRETSFRNG
jgi:hypothetical protein